MDATITDGFGDTDVITSFRRIDGTHNDDAFFGGASDDRFVTNRGDDEVSGGGGWNALDYRRTGLDVIDADLNSGEIINVWDGQTFTDTVEDVQEVRGSRSGDDVIRGSDRDDYLEVRDGADEVHGGGGNDEIRDLGQDDGNSLFGGDGNDRIVGGDGADFINPGGNSSEDIIIASLGADMMDFQDAVPGAFYSVTYEDLDGSVAANIGVADGAVDKTQDGSTDTLLALQSIDDEDGLLIVGALSDDTLTSTRQDCTELRSLGGDARLTFSRYADSGVEVTITGYDADGAMGTAVDECGDNDAFAGIRDFRGTRNDDVFNGGGQRDSFILDEGDDTVNGGGGVDRVRYDRNGVDRLILDFAAQTAQVIWGGQDFTGTLISIEEVSGSDTGSDVMRGSGADEVLDGRGGGDTLDGRGGADRLIGGAGDDIFVVHRGPGDDVIEDFVLGEDVPDLTAFTYAQVVDAFRAARKGDTRQLAGGGSLQLLGIDLEDLEEENAILSGFPSNRADKIVGSNGRDEIRLGGGRDSFDDRGNDPLIGAGRPQEPPRDRVFPMRSPQADREGAHPAAIGTVRAGGTPGAAEPARRSAGGAGGRRELRIPPPLAGRRAWPRRRRQGRTAALRSRSRWSRR
jgi:Ca2+-binding RTX toxin-like protein